MLSILIVSHGHEKFFVEQMNSIIKFISIPYEVILVDNINNGSFFKEIINESNYNHIRLVTNLKVKSFSENNNLAASIAKYDNLFILNPDTYLIDDSISNFLQHSQNINEGLFFPKLLNPDGSLQSTARAKPNFFHGLKSLICYKLGVKLEPIEGEYWYFGAAIFCNKKFFSQIKGFDEIFPMYGEDTELCDRVRKMKYPVKYLENIQLVHHLGGEAKSRYLSKAIVSNAYYWCKSLSNTLKYR